MSKFNWRFLVLVLLPGCIIDSLADVRIVTTSSGRGADATIARDNPQANDGAANTISLKSVPPAPPGSDLSSRKALLRFDRNAMNQQLGRTEKAQLLLTLAADVNAAKTLHVYGLGDDGLHDGSLTAEAWDEAQINWAFAPANNVLSADGDDILEGDDPGRAERLGTISIPAGSKQGQVFSFTGAPLVAFLNKDRNYVIGFILTSSGQDGVVVSFVSGEGVTAAQPALSITAPPANAPEPFSIFNTFSYPEFGSPFLEWRSEPGRTYQVQISENLSVWTDAAGGRLTANSTLSSFVDNDASEKVIRFYRIADVTAPPVREDSQTLLTKGINNTVNPIVQTTQKHTEGELADFNEPGETPGRVLANPADPNTYVNAVLLNGGAVLDVGEDATLKQPVLGRLVAPVDPIISQIDFLIQAADEFTGFSRAVDGNPSPNVSPDTFVNLISGFPGVVQNNAEALAFPFLFYQAQLEAQAAYVQQLADGIVAEPGPDSVTAALLGLALESPLLVGPVIDILYNVGGDGYDATVGAGNAAVGGFIGGPDPNKGIDFATYLLLVAPEIPQAWVHTVPSGTSALVIYGLGFTSPFFTLPGLEMLRPATTGVGQALSP